MVRTTIACARCRKFKVKCVHEGSSPCRNCVRKGRAASEECFLSPPELKPRKPRSQGERPLGTRQGLSHTNPGTANTNLCESQGEDLLRNTSASTVLQAASLFNSKFPELRFLHMPSFSKLVKGTYGGDTSRTNHRNDEGFRQKFHVLCSALLAVCSRFMSPNLQDTIYKKYCRDALYAVEIPDILTVQALLIVAITEWGTGNGYRAWMDSGMAIRMMQSLLVLTKSGTLSELEQEIHNRTLWSCFIMDRFIFCGKSQPSALSVNCLHTHWPIGERDFAFGQCPGPRQPTDNRQALLQYMKGDIDHYYGILVRGFDIWARILKWIVSGGRRQRGMCLPENHPWMDGSPWRSMYDELCAWRELHEHRIRYPDSQIESHASLGQGEVCCYLNLLYYVSLLFLGREYIPFLPTSETEPCGPVDAPLLTEPPPEGWWSDRANELFTSAAYIVNILQDLEDASTPLMTPFAGFCSFSAASMNIYIAAFPKMNLGRSTDTSSIVATNMNFLDKFRRMWPMGEGWWITIQHSQMLYERASQDRARFRGRTRADFEALEYSMHDCRGQPPSQADLMLQNLMIDRSRDHGDADHAAEAALGLQELSGLPVHESQENLSDDLGNIQIWPLWGEQQNFPFAVEGIPFDYNLNMLNTYLE